jgi:hypothetical protein
MLSAQFTTPARSGGRNPLESIANQKPESAHGSEKRGQSMGLAVKPNFASLGYASAEPIQSAIVFLFLMTSEKLSNMKECNFKRDQSPGFFDDQVRLIYIK